MTSEIDLRTSYVMSC